MNYAHRGTRHLRVAIEVSEEGLKVLSLRTVDQPVVQRAELYKPILVRVEVGGTPVFVDAVPDPRRTRGINDPQRGHSFGRAAAGVVQASIPFDDPGEILNAEIRIVDVSQAVKRVHDAEALSALVDEGEEAVLTLGVVTPTQLAEHRDWERVAETLDLPRYLDFMR